MFLWLHMRRLNPPIHLLRAFVATARFGSVSRAAQSLHVTQSAVSKQVRELEDWLNVALFERVRKRLVLTQAGQGYEAAVQPLLAQLEAATLELISASSGGGALHLSMLPTIGAKWLIPRLPKFLALHPQITLHFVPYVQGYDFQRPDLDCSILFGEGLWPGAQTDYLIGRELVLIAPPKARGRAELRRPRDVQRFVRLQHVAVPDVWQRWCERHAVTGLDPMAGPQLDQFHSLIRAVAAGMGVALVPQCLVQDDISSGLVTAPSIESYVDTRGYHLCYPERKAQMPALRAFRAWLLVECAGAQQRHPDR
jgi:LysR family transcriptional regulator, glycine cleavage system transcriptional activator